MQTQTQTTRTSALVLTATDVLELTAAAGAPLTVTAETTTTDIRDLVLDTMDALTAAGHELGDLVAIHLIEHLTAVREALVGTEVEELPLTSWTLADQDITEVFDPSPTVTESACTDCGLVLEDEDACTRPGCYVPTLTQVARAAITGAGLALDDAPPVLADAVFELIEAAEALLAAQTV